MEMYSSVWSPVAGRERRYVCGREVRVREGLVYSNISGEDNRTIGRPKVNELFKLTHALIHQFY